MDQADLHGLLNDPGFEGSTGDWLPLSRAMLREAEPHSATARIRALTT